MKKITTIHLAVALLCSLVFVGPAFPQRAFAPEPARRIELHPHPTSEPGGLKDERLSEFEAKAKKRLELASGVNPTPQMRQGDSIFMTAIQRGGPASQQYVFRFTEKLIAGRIVSRSVLASPPFSLVKLYAEAFANEARYDLLLPDPLLSRTLVIDEALFRHGTQFSSVLGIEMPAAQKTAMLFSDRVIPLKRLQVDGRETFFELMKEPALIGRIPPKLGSYFTTVSESRFVKRDFSLVNFEGNSDTLGVIKSAKLNNGLNVAMNLTEYKTIDSGVLRNLETEFRLRSGRVIAVLGHHDNDSFIVRRQGVEVGRISTQSLHEWANKYNVSLVMLGCKTINSDRGQVPAAGTVSDINSYETAIALVRALSSNTWGDFLGALSSEQAPLMIADGWQTNTDTGILARLLKRDADGNASIVGFVLFVFKCNLLGKC